MQTDIILKTKSQRMDSAVKLIQGLALSDINVLIVGGHGTGRDTAAHEIHNLSRRRSETLRIVRCNEVSEKDMALDSGECVYLDELHCLSGRSQLRLMKELKRAKNTRVIASATYALGPKIDDGKFSYDLYLMIAQGRVELPSINDRREDMRQIIRFHLVRLCKKYNKQVRLDGEALKLLVSYRYEAGITELANILERAVIINKSGIIRSNSIMSILDMENVTYASLICGSGLDLREELKRFECQLIETALADRGTLNDAAAQLGLPVTTLWRKCASYGISTGNKADCTKNSKADSAIESQISSEMQGAD